MLARLLIALAALLAGPAAAQVSPIAIGQSHSVVSRHLGDARRINIYLPPGYEAASEQRYPVLYLIDGGLDQDFLHVVGSSHLGALWGRSQPVIVVGVETKDRRRELVGPTADPELLKKYPTAGQSAAFRAFLRDEVKPLVARSYRVSGEDAVIGESLAGLFIVETWLREPALFDRYAAISPSLWWDKEALSREAASLLAKTRAERPALYLTIANEGTEMQAGMDRLMALLSGQPLHRWCYAPRPQTTHATIYHGVVPEALQYLFPTAVAPAAETGFLLSCSPKS